MDGQPAYLQGVGRGRGRGQPQVTNHQGKQPSAWGRSRVSSSNSSSSNSPSGTPTKKRTHNTADERFNHAATQHQASAQRHLDKELSDEPSDDDDEEELHDEDILQATVKSFNAVSMNGDVQDLGRTQEYLLTSVKSKANVCLVCIEAIKKTEAIWSCKGCFTMFHISCIQKWVKEGAYQKAQFEEEDNKEVPWCCPKCRHEYRPLECPTRYFCFCGKEEDPAFDPWIVPHSCGEVCGKDLLPQCGHTCLLLCHPGPCPPCPKVVQVTCYCEKQAPQTRRCGKQQWSCGQKCQRPLACGHHICPEPCHEGDCPPCAERSMQPCMCGREIVMRPCASPDWHCQQACGKTLSCGHHVCETICHSGQCSSCPRSGPRTCPCGKTKFELPCTQDVPTCVDTCDKVLECGLHRCTQKCHTGPCGICREMTVKWCRCGRKKKDIQCCREFLCDTKCTRMKDCRRHMCKRKCCIGDCPPCELTCGKPLSCGNHKCSSRCHPGPCYPCPLTVTIKCFCGATSITLPCGRERVTKPPRCSQKCKIPPVCHHPSRSPHSCHFGQCPPCKQTCDRPLPNCQHKCPQRCHTQVYTKVQPKQQRSGPWEPKLEARMEYVDYPCPPCKVPVPVNCLGQHEVVQMACSEARVTSCHRPCGRALACGNHTCQLECHVVKNAADDNSAGETCQPCEEPCLHARPEGCTHSCLLPCHTGDCPPCQQMIRMRCHCTLVVRYIECDQWTHADDRERERLKSCKQRCPRQLPCSHNCKALCHPGLCPNPERCTEKVKVKCPCKRLRSEFLCNEVQAGLAVMACDEDCEQEKHKRKQQRAIEEEARRLEEKKRQEEELAEFERRKQGKRRRQRKQRPEEELPSFFHRYGRFILGPLLVILLAMFMFYLFNT